MYRFLMSAVTNCHQLGGLGQQEFILEARNLKSLSLCWNLPTALGFPGGASGKEPTCQGQRCKR